MFGRFDSVIAQGVQITHKDILNPLYIMNLNKEEGGHKPFWQSYFLFYVVGLVGSLLLAGGPRQAASGVFLVFSGLGMLFCPPKTSVSWKFWLLGAILIVAFCLPLLPEGMLSIPNWRIFLAGMPGFHGSPLVTVSPRETIYWIVVASLSVVIGLCALSHPLSKKGLEFYALLSVLGVSVYTLMAMAVWMNGWHYKFFEPDPLAQPCFGFFPSRNQTSSLLLSATIVSAALIMQFLSTGKLLRGACVGSILAILASGVLFFSKSRGGVVFLFFGLVLWVAGLGRKRVGFMIPVLVPVILALLIFFIASPGGARDRLFGLEQRGHEHAAGALHKGGELGMSSRLRIFNDTFHMIGAYPLTGSGLGTYAYVYPFYSDKSLSEATALHSESDWLTLLEEGGPLALAAAWGLLILLCVRMKKLSVSDSWPLRWGIFCAFLAEVIHGFVDVPAHRPELGWWMLLLATLPAASMATKSSFLVLQRGIYMFAGIAALVLGMALIGAQWMGVKPLPPYYVRDAVARIISQYSTGKYDEASDVVNRARSDYPMGWELSYLQGVISLAQGGASGDATSFFDIESALRPGNEVPSQKAGTALASYDPDHASLYWKEAVRRRLRMDSSSNCPIARSNELFRSMLADKTMRPAFLKQAGEIATWSPGLRMIWLADDGCSPVELSAALHDTTFMNQLSVKQQGELLQSWWQRGDRKEVSEFLDSHPEYTAAGVNTRAAMLLAAGQPEQACRLLISTYGIPQATKTSGSTSIQAADSDVPPEPLLAARYYMEHGNSVAARHILEGASKEAKSTAVQAEILLLKAQLEMTAGNWVNAFPLLTSYLRASGQL